MGNNLGLLDILTVASFLLDLQNLELNKHQSTHLDNNSFANQNYTNVFEEIIAQNKILIKQNKEIITLLRGKNDENNKIN